MGTAHHIIISILIMNILSCTSETTTVISYNIRYDNQWDKENSWDTRKESIVGIFEKYSPSFIGTQEGLAHQIHYMDSALTEYDYIGVGREDGEKKGEFCAIYYISDTYNVIESSTFWLSDNPENVSIGWDAALERICTYGLFEHKQSKNRIWVFNTHFDHMGEIARRKSSELILQKINDLNSFSGPIILMGDFNSLPNSKPVYTILKEFKDETLYNHDTKEWLKYDNGVWIKDSISNITWRSQKFLLEVFPEVARLEEGQEFRLKQLARDDSEQ